jgi:hypothetical protein
MEAFLRGRRIRQMKQANDNEMDLLLRSLARGRKQTAWQSGSEDGEQVSSAHLDADELNSYAEGVAPAPARARYMEHLADCDACRGILVGLSQAAGAANRFEVPEQKGGAGFWQKVSQFFSPTVLRYAVPALVLTAVIGIGLVVMRQQKDFRFVAQNERQVAAPPVVSSQPDSNGGAAAKSDGTVQKQVSGKNPEKVKEVPALERNETDAREDSSKPDASVMKAPAKDAGQATGIATATESRPYASEPNAAAPPPPAPLRDAEKSAELAKARPAKREDQPRDQDEAYRVQSDDVHGPNRSRSNTDRPASQRGAGVMGGARGPSGMDKKKAGETETRSVMGRQFTREGDAWVDTAYESPRATVRVTRGSEQFRALVADEPGLRTISEQLGGVVIVVWKNRAYRIQ